VQPGGFNPQAIFNGTLFNGEFTGILGNESIAIPGSNPTIQFPMTSSDEHNVIDARFQGTVNPAFANLAAFPADVLYTGQFATIITSLSPASLDHSGFH
jgi:hypothetical protein